MWKPKKPVTVGLVVALGAGVLGGVIGAALVLSQPSTPPAHKVALIQKAADTGSTTTTTTGLPVTTTTVAPPVTTTTLTPQGAASSANQSAQAAAQSATAAAQSASSAAQSAQQAQVPASVPTTTTTLSEPLAISPSSCTQGGGTTSTSAPSGWPYAPAVAYCTTPGGVVDPEF